MIPKCHVCGNIDRFTAVVRYVDFYLRRVGADYRVTGWANPDRMVVFCDLCGDELPNETAESIRQRIVGRF